MHFYQNVSKSSASQTPEPRRLEISTSGKRHFVKHEDIMHIEACGSYSTIFLGTGRRITISKNLKRIEAILDDPTFFRVHNSQIVNLTRIHQCNYRLHQVTLDNGKEIPLAVRKREQLRHQMQQLMSS